MVALASFRASLLPRLLPLRLCLITSTVLSTGAAGPARNPARSSPAPLHHLTLPPAYGPAGFCVATRLASSRAAHAMAQALHPRAAAVLDFWFGEGWQAAGANDRPTDRFKIWYGGGAELDAQIVALFGADCEALLAGQYDGWQAGPAPEALAGVIIGDQVLLRPCCFSALLLAAWTRLAGIAAALALLRCCRATPPHQTSSLLAPPFSSSSSSLAHSCSATPSGAQRKCMRPTRRCFPG